MIVSANDVKTKGVTFLGKLLKNADELIINVRGKNKYVVLDIERYQAFRQQELDLAHLLTMREIEEGRYKTQTAKEHAEELMNAL
ncbi:type II toxin-antitoxin system Phd/YefM family antitoxin [Marinospirillum sp.]|uniref:type II toxin-antitoxin system Phd/YefM family antitoxin n=1 Tax=Marinospirillum sp. TaxID=2183934 RepID=UPI0028709638|nr:type II toxin-antitoxin system Phd/YefM family antitoxin [Marinospirillum sp.]MDR9467065.1 type II toxin-antitoxin system Phd/YefM family antitoxin [Marinospirillum sp.]